MTPGRRHAADLGQSLQQAVSNTVRDDLPLLGSEFGLNASPGRPRATAPLMVKAFADVEGRIAAEGLVNRHARSAGAKSKTLPALPFVSVLDTAAEPLLHDRVTTVVECLQQVVRRYSRDSEVQRLLEVPPMLHEWIMWQKQPERLRVDFCRLDLLGDTMGSVRVLEFNPSSPGGVLSHGVLNRAWRASALGDVLNEAGAARAPIEADEWFAEWLTGFGRRKGLNSEEIRRVGLFTSANGTSFEFDLMRAQLRNLGCTPVVLEADDAKEAAELRLGYLKLQRNVRKTADWDVFQSRVAEGDLIIPNVPAVRWVAENKLCLAILSDPRFRHLFTADQASALDALVPFSRKLGDGITELETVAGRGDLVLKAPYSYWGRDVFIGVDTTPDVWKAVVRDPAHRGWLVQQRVPTRAVQTDRGAYYRDLIVPVLDGRVIGYGSRVSKNRILNLAHGAAAAAVFGPCPRP